jgi:hypothetical protein
MGRHGTPSDRTEIPRGPADWPPGHSLGHTVEASIRFTDPEHCRWQAGSTSLSPRHGPSRDPPPANEEPRAHHPGAPRVLHPCLGPHLPTHAAHQRRLVRGRAAHQSPGRPRGPRHRPSHRGPRRQGGPRGRPGHRPPQLRHPRGHRHRGLRHRRHRGPARPHGRARRGDRHLGSPHGSACSGLAPRLRRHPGYRRRSAPADPATPGPPALADDLGVAGWVHRVPRRTPQR